MKKFSTIFTINFLIILSFSSLLAQPYYDWGKQLGDVNYDYGYAISTDKSGNVYSAGSFYGVADMDPRSAVYQVTSTGDAAYISKLDASGDFVWACSFSGTGSSFISEIKNDDEGNVYSTGYFYGTIDFDPSNSVNDLTSNGNVDVFISKLDKDGNFLWVKHIGGAADDYATGITLDNFGNIITTGYFGHVVDFNPGTGSNILTCNGNVAAFICKLNPNGNYIWAKTFQGTGDHDGRAVVVNSSNEIISTGGYEGTVDFDPGITTYSLTYRGVKDIYFNALDSNGNFLWAKSIGGTQASEVNAMCIDEDDNIYSTGWFFDICDFDPSSNTTNLTTTGNQDVFVCKLNSTGNYLWAKNFGGTITDIGFSIAVDKFKNVYTTGNFRSSADLDPGSNTATFTTSGGDDVFISKLNENGNYVWAKQLGGTGFDNGGRGITIGLKRVIYTTGYFNGDIDMNPNPAADVVSSFGSLDGFVQKMSQCTDVNRSISVSSCYSYTSPSGKYTWTSSNVYKDTISKVDGCDSILTINLTINTRKNSIINVNSCNDYRSPSGKYKWTNSATYKDTVLSKSGCDSIITINLTITVLDVSVSMNGNTLSANVDAANYQWLDCNNSNYAIPNATNKIFTPNVNGSYSVLITKNGCSDTSACYTISTASIESNTIKGVKIYPNPSSGLVFINTQEFLENAKIKVLDVTGKLLLELNNQNGNDFTIDLSSLTSSIYILEITEGDRKYIVKLYR